jgi:flagellar FliL protein
MAVIEQRVVNERPKIGPRGGGGAARPEPEAEVEATPKKSKKKLLLILGVVVVLAAAAAYYFLVMAKGSAAAEPAAPEPGAVHKVEAMSINLADGRYLRIAVGLQLTLDGGTDGHGGEFDDSKARNAIIDLFSGRPVAEVAPGEAREALRQELATTLEESYHGGVMDVYLIDFVTQ